MIWNRILRLALLPAGFILKCIELAIAGTRDIVNCFRFAKVRIDRGCCIDSATVIGPHCHVLENCLLINVQMDSYTYLNRNSIIQNATVGAFCSISSEVMIGLGIHPMTLVSTSTLFYRRSNTLGIPLVDQDHPGPEYRPIEVGHDVWIGARAVLMDGVRVGTGAVVAANAVVTKDVPPYAVVGGVPARVLRYRFSEERIAELLASKWWTLPLKEIKAGYAQSAGHLESEVSR